MNGDSMQNETKEDGAVTLNPQEISRFDAQKSDWWSKEGPLGPLLDMNPLRLEFIQDQLKRSFSLSDDLPYQALDILDVGCGAGLVCEPLARLGANVTGIDASETAITQARMHAVEQNLDIHYQRLTIEEKKTEGLLFDVITALEVVEHVDHVDAFLKTCVQMLKPNGVLIVSTLNRTVYSYLKAIVIAEYIFQWVPKKTHSWHQFLKPSEIAQILQTESCFLTNIRGMTLNPITKEWSLTQKIDTNYILSAIKRS